MENSRNVLICIFDSHELLLYLLFKNYKTAFTKGAVTAPKGRDKETQYIQVLIGNDDTCQSVFETHS